MLAILEEEEAEEEEGEEENVKGFRTAIPNDFGDGRDQIALPERHGG